MRYAAPWPSVPKGKGYRAYVKIYKHELRIKKMKKRYDLRKPMVETERSYR